MAGADVPFSDASFTTSHVATDGSLDPARHWNGTAITDQGPVAFHDVVNWNLWRTPISEGARA